MSQMHELYAQLHCFKTSYPQCNIPNKIWFYFDDKIRALESTFRKFRKNPLAVFGLLYILLCCIIAILGYWVIPDKSYAANQMHIELSLKAPGYRADFISPADSTISPSWFQILKNGRPDQPSLYLSSNSGDSSLTNWITAQTWYPPEEIVQHIETKHFLLGTDIFGRDVWSRLLLGTRVSLSVGLISVLISIVLGIFFGLMAGYYRGWVDNVVMWLINVIWSLPTLLLVIAITFALGKGFWQIFIAVGITMWVELARIVRGQVFSLREMEYIQAAKMLGYSDFRIMFKHMLPNLVGPIVVISAANFASAILLEAGLSFLGLGVQPPFPSWGQMLNENYSYIAFNAAHLALAPGLAIMLLVMSFNFVGNGLRDALDVRM